MTVLNGRFTVSSDPESHEVTMSAKPSASRKLFFAIATDLHFWIPLSVLVGGLLLLDKLR